MAYEMYTYMAHDYSKVDRYLVRPTYMFKYWGFHWVPRLSMDQWQLFFKCMMGLALGVAVGFMYQLSATLFFLGFSFLILQDMGLYLNHFYLIAIFNFLFIFLPVARFAAVDVHLGFQTHSYTAPRWCLESVRLLLGIVYFYAGVAKMNVDWLRCEPLVHWLYTASGSLPFGLRWLQETKELACFFSYGGLIMDTLVAFTLYHPRTRMISFIITMGFHATNKIILNIGVFPYVMAVVSFVFFDPHWPLIVLRQVGKLPAAVIPYGKPSIGGRERRVLYLLALLFAHQILVPLRYLVVGRNVEWDEVGHRWSWRMKLRDKSGILEFFIVDPDTGRISDPVRPRDFLTRKQAKKVPGRPELIHRFAHYVADRVAEYRNTTERPEIHAIAIVSLNNRFPQYMVDPRADLAAEPLFENSPPNFVVPLVPRGERDYTRIPWPINDVLPESNPHAYEDGLHDQLHGEVWYSTRTLHRMYRGFTLKQAMDTFGREPASRDELYRSLD